MNRSREIIDNAHMGSFVHSMKSDTVHAFSFVQAPDLNQLLLSYMPYYNGVRSTPVSVTVHRSRMKRTRDDRIP